MTDELHPGLPEEDIPAAETPAEAAAEPQTQDAPAPVETGAPEAAEASAAPEAAEAPAAQETAASPAPKKKSALPWILAGVITVLVAAVIVLVVKLAAGSPAQTPDSPAIEAPADTPDSTQPDDQTPAAEDETNGQTGEEDTEPAGNGVSYTVDADALTDDVLGQTVARCGDDRLTNRELPYYYWQQYYAFLSSYGAYASYFLDTSTPFDQQMCMFDESITWQQYFLDGAIETYKSISSLWQDARLAGFQLGQEDQDYLDELSNNITISAVSYGFDSADAYLQTAYGPAATMTGYHDFVERYLTASTYLQALTDAKEYSEADISAYYDENAESYASSAIEKDDTKMVNVRHILIQPSEQNDDGTYTDEAWAEAEQKAKDILAQWQSGEHTEDSFAYLAVENSQDPGSAENGGLYEEVYPGQMVDAFDAWCFNAARKPGDTGIVKTDYGYHIMFFSSQCEHPYWYVRAESDYLNEVSAACAEEVAAKFTSEVTVENAALTDVLQAESAAG